MQIDWLYSLASLLLLFPPSTIFYSRVAKERLQELTDQSFPLEKMIVKWQHWIDLLRAAIGTFLLSSLAVSQPPEVEHGALIELGVVGVLLPLAVIAQTAHYYKGLYLTAPVFFLWGLTAVLVGPIPAVFSIVFSAAFARAFNHVDLQFLIMAGLLLTVGYATEAFSLSLALASVLAALPVVFSYAAAGSLACYSAKIGS